MRSVWLAIALAGCFGASPPEGIPCASTDECPRGQTCSNQQCTSHPDDVIPPDGADPTCACIGDDLSCASGTTPCAIGCVADPTARCVALVPSNGAPTDELATADMPIVFSGDALIDTDTGEITGSVTRAPGPAAIDHIVFRQVGQFGVFTFQRLTIDANATVTFKGGQSVIFVVAETATIDGTIDGRPACDATNPGCAGPGGGDGGSRAAVAEGCGAGAPGTNSTTSTADGGGGGGGGATIGAAGGEGTSGGAGTAGAAGVACLPSTGEPLIGGSGGGMGSQGTATDPEGIGGGGGGGIQISSFESITVSGVINMGGGGGPGGPGGGGMGAAAAGGGGSGGTILLEAPTVTISGVLAANGGGGGGGGNASTAGTAGQPGQASTTAAIGGMGVTGGNGGAGAVEGTAATAGASATFNGGGGGGGVGVIFLRTKTSPTLGGTVSPAAGSDTIRTN